MVKKRKRNLVIISAVVFVICLTILKAYFFLQNRSQDIKKINSPDKQSEQTQLIPTIVPTNTKSPAREISKPTIVATKIIEKDTTPPKAYILSPQDWSHVQSGVKIVANVTDNIKIDRVEFYAGSSDYQLIGVLRQAPFEVIWVPSDGFKGYGNKNNIPIYIKAYDSSGNYGGSFISVYLDQ